jgi:hypothetical protein
MLVKLFGLSLALVLHICCCGLGVGSVAFVAAVLWFCGFGLRFWESWSLWIFGKFCYTNANA